MYEVPYVSTLNPKKRVAKTLCCSVSTPPGQLNSPRSATPHPQSDDNNEVDADSNDVECVQLQGGHFGNCHHSEDSRGSAGLAGAPCRQSRVDSEGSDGLADAPKGSDADPYRSGQESPTCGLAAGGSARSMHLSDGSDCTSEGGINKLVVVTVLSIVTVGPDMADPVPIRFSPGPPAPREQGIGATLFKHPVTVGELLVLKLAGRDPSPSLMPWRTSTTAPSEEPMRKDSASRSRQTPAFRLTCRTSWRPAHKK